MAESADNRPTGPGGQEITREGITREGIPGEGMLVVIDPGVLGRDLFIKRRLPGAALLLLDIEQNAVEQITEALHRTAVPFASLHIVVNVSSGALRFTSGELSLKTLKPAVEQLQTWFGQDSTALSVLDPKIFIYAPFADASLRAKSIGRELLDTLTWLTSATIIEVASQTKKRQWAQSAQNADPQGWSSEFFDQFPLELAFSPDI